MSKTQLQKPTTAVICDYCHKEIPPHTEPREWAHIVRSYLSPPTNEKTIKHLIFKWERKYPQENVEYDFHVVCFDEMVQKLTEATPPKGDTA